jgi:glutamate--cysteine ligase
MLRTCLTKVGLNYASEADMVKKYRVALALQPVATALFASSPFEEGKPNGYLSNRMRCWGDTDLERCGIVPFVFEDGFGFERYVDYALDVPMIFLRRNGHTIDCSGQSFRDFLQGKLPVLPGVLPTLGDWEHHLSSLFPDVRLKRTVSMRGADSASAEMLLALPSFWTGILYDSLALDGAWELVKDWTIEERWQLREAVPRLGFQAEIRGRKVLDIANSAVTLSRQGLRRRIHRLHGGADETRYIDLLFNNIEISQNPADQMLMRFQLYPDFKMADVFDMCRLLPPPLLRDMD